MVSKQVKEEDNLEVGVKLVRHVLREDLKLSYVMGKKLHPQVNSDRCLVLRQQSALQMLTLLEQGKRVINLDETWLSEVSFVRKTWAARGGRGNAALNALSPRLSVIAAIDTDGRVWFSLSHSNTDSHTTALFLQHLVDRLNVETPGW